MLAMLVPMAMGVSSDSEGNPCGVGAGDVVDAAAVDSNGSDGTGSPGLQLAAHIAPDAQGNRSVISPELIHSIVVLAKEAGCSAVRIIGAAENQSVTEDLQKEATKAQLKVVNDDAQIEHADMGDEAELPTAQQVINKLQSALASGKGALALDLPVDAQGKVGDKAMQVLRRVGGWMSVNGRSVRDVTSVDLGLPEGWSATVAVDENTYLHPPVMHPSRDVVLKIPAHLIDTVVPEVLGQPEQVVRVKRVEEPGDDEPSAFMQFSIPAAVWDQAVEGLPVIKLLNAQ